MIWEMGMNQEVAIWILMRNVISIISIETANLLYAVIEGYRRFRGDRFLHRQG